jgi:hypothetical protein
MRPDEAHTRLPPTERSTGVCLGLPGAGPLPVPAVREAPQGSAMEPTIVTESRRRGRAVTALAALTGAKLVPVGWLAIRSVTEKGCSDRTGAALAPARPAQPAMRWPRRGGCIGSG